MNATTAIVAASYFLLIVYFTRRGVKRGVTSLDEFTIGGWSLGLVMNVAFFTATWVSAASVLGVPGLLYGNGFATVTGWFGGWFFANALLPVIAFKIRRPEFPVRTMPEFMRLRYEPFVERSGLQVYGALIMVAGYLSYMTIQIAGIGYIVSALTGIPYELSILVFLVFVMITVVGGVWSVAITDLFNVIVLVIGLLVAAITVLPQVGGWSEMFAQAMLIDTPATPGAEPMVGGEFFSPLGSFTLAAMIGVFLSNSLGASVAPHWPTRLLSAKDVRTAVLTPLLANSILVVVFVCLLILGVGGRVLVPTMPEGLATDQIVPLLATDFMNSGVAGVLLAAIFAAALSTANGMVLHTAIAGTYDIFRNLRKDRIEDRALIRLTQILLMVMAIVATLLSIRPPAFIALLATYVFGGFGAAFIAPVYLGLYWKRANRQAAYVSTLIGPATFVVLLVAVELGWYSGVVPPVLVAIGVSVAAMVVCTLVFPHAPREAWEPYFEETISPETKRVIDRAMRNIAR
ncbi:MAG: sodium:solute symporter family protein [Gemmatimonadota bacterium]|jgi:sodium/pantothenate symporter